KLTTAKQCVAVCSEALECFGGAGYVEDTGLPALLRDAQVFPIWEGTTNVLALDALRTASGGTALRSLSAVVYDIEGKIADPEFQGSVARAREAMEKVRHAITHLSSGEQERNARRIALTLGRALALALLCAQAQWSLGNGQDPSSTASARRFRIADLGGGLDA
ncbi:MAG: acyl-CoA dehydrogenase family protein, partial [Burkholderiales bacterium]